MSTRTAQTENASAQYTNRESRIDLGSLGGIVSNQLESSQPPRQPLNQAKNGPESRDTDIAVDHVSRFRDKNNSHGQDAVGPRPQHATEIITGGKVNHSSPWNTYVRGYDLELDKFVTVATRKHPRSGLVVIKEMPQESNNVLILLGTIRNERVVEVLEVFAFEQKYFVVLEYIPVTLREVARSPPYPTEQQLATILEQILAGLDYLSSMGLQHGALTCASVLMKPDGEVKLAGQESCRRTSAKSVTDVRAVGHIAVELMQKYPNDNDNATIGIENLNRWAPDSEAVNFLSLTASAESIQVLRKHQLFKKKGTTSELALLVAFASFSVRRAYRYSG